MVLFGSPPHSISSMVFARVTGGYRTPRWRIVWKARRLSTAFAARSLIQWRVSFDFMAPVKAMFRLLLFIHLPFFTAIDVHDTPELLRKADSFGRHETVYQSRLARRAMEVRLESDPDALAARGSRCYQVQAFIRRTNPWLLQLRWCCM